jgi:hypothetical protein
MLLSALSAFLSGDGYYLFVLLVLADFPDITETSFLFPLEGLGLSPFTDLSID